MPEQRARIRAWVQEKHPHLERRIGHHWNECRDWHLANGVDRADWEAAFRMWLRKTVEIQRREGRPPDRPRRRSEPEQLGVMQLLGVIPQGETLLDVEPEGEA
jgi:hypothetical protein